MWRWPLRRQDGEIEPEERKVLEEIGLPVFWVFVWRITCEGKLTKTSPGCGCHTPSVSGGGWWIFHQQNQVGAGRNGVLVPCGHCGIAVAGW